MQGESLITIVWGIFVISRILFLKIVIMVTSYICYIRILWVKCNRPFTYLKNFLN